MSKQLNEKELNLVRRFFDYDLSDDELKDFEERLENDASFAKEVDNYSLAYTTVDQWVKINKKQDISTKKKAFNNLRWLFAFLLVIGLMFTAYYFTMQNRSSETNEAIFAQIDEYTTLMSDDILRSNDIDSIPLKNQLLKEILSNSKVIKPSATITKLEDFIKTTDDLSNKELAEWWLVTINLEQNNEAKAKDALQSIKNNPSYNSSKKAASFLEKW